MCEQVWSSMREATSSGRADDVSGLCITRLGAMPAAEAAAWRAVLDRRRREPMGVLPELVVADIEPEPLSRCAAVHTLVDKHQAAAGCLSAGCCDLCLHLTL